MLRAFCRRGRLRYHARDVRLIEKNPVIAGMQRYLIGASSAEILRIPCVTRRDDLPP